MGNPSQSYEARQVRVVGDRPNDLQKVSSQSCDILNTYKNAWESSSLHKRNYCFRVVTFFVIFKINTKTVVHD